MNPLFDQAMNIALTYDVTTLKDKLVLYSISYLPTTENRDKAFNFVRQHSGSQTIENTPCGNKLIELDLSQPQHNLTSENIAQIWATASKRMIQKAQGHITAFVDGADPRSVFCQTELPAILENPDISTINNIDKHIFAQQIRNNQEVHK